MSRARQRRRAEARRRRLRRGIVAGLVVVVTTVGIGVVRLLRSDTDPAVDRALSEEVDGPAVVPARVPEAYRVEYRVADLLDEPARLTTEVLDVRRPFDGRVDTYEGDGVGGALVSEQITSFGRLSTRTSAPDPVVLAVDPTMTPVDVRIDAVLDDALERGRVERRERRVVSGRACSVLRSREPLTAGPLAAATEEDWTDTCVDGAGLVVEEILYIGGNPVRRKVAVAVDESPRFPDDHFAVGEPSLAPAEGGGSVEELAPDSLPPGRVYDGGVPPPGFDVRGRYAVIPPQPGAAGDPMTEATRRASVADVYVRGVDAVIVDRGATLMGTEFYGADPDAADVQAGIFDDVDVILDAGGVELRALPRQGSWVRVVGTLVPARLQDVLATVREVEGNTIRYR